MYNHLNDGPTSRLITKKCIHMPPAAIATRMND